MKFCLNCTSEIQHFGVKFCSRSCAATYNNKLHPKRDPVNRVCSGCSATYVRSRSRYCEPCRRSVQRDEMDSMTLAEVLAVETKHLRSRYNTIRSNARSRMRQLSRKCAACGYDKAVQVCHLKGIATWPLDTPIATINGPDNLLLLCPNHHWELDHGLFDATV